VRIENGGKPYRKYGSKKMEMKLLIKSAYNRRRLTWHVRPAARPVIRAPCPAGACHAPHALIIHRLPA